MGIVTGAGDRRRTRLISGEEVAKSDPRIEAVGAIDELNSHMGLARAMAEKYGGRLSGQAREMRELQLELFRMAGELCCADISKQGWVEPTSVRHVESIEARIAALERSIELPRSFIVPGACDASAALDMARAVARRLERHAVRMSEDGLYDNEQGLVYLNRLSDYLFLLARAIEKAAGVPFSTKEGQ
ncbi:MAG: cob(I)yrinic acid a,c-diamide adenosyltransferase [Proteobacteria bacterium]|nr:cob(I)yrinic acid a,c-diamide adenosyltransferase [Pseudomonadota bacterium]